MNVKYSRRESALSILHSDFYVTSRARYRTLRYVIVNNVTSVAFESKMKKARKRDWPKQNENRLKILYLDISDSFKEAERPRAMVHRAVHGTEGQ